MGQVGSVVCQYCPDDVLASIDGGTSAAFPDLDTQQEIRVAGIPTQAAIEDKQARQREAASVATEIHDYTRRALQEMWIKFFDEVAVQRKVWESQAIGQGGDNEHIAVLNSQFDHILETHQSGNNDDALSVLRLIVEEAPHSFSTSIIAATQGIFEEDELRHSRDLLAEQLEALSLGEAPNDTMKSILKAAKIKDKKLEARVLQVLGESKKKGGKNVRWS